MFLFNGCFAVRCSLLFLCFFFSWDTFALKTRYIWASVFVSFISICLSFHSNSKLSYATKTSFIFTPRLSDLIHYLICVVFCFEINANKLKIAKSLMLLSYWIMLFIAHESVSRHHHHHRFGLIN